jgi:hypothetical protein
LRKSGKSRGGVKCEIRGSYPKASVSFLALDLFSLNSVRRFAAAGRDMPPLQRKIMMSAPFVKFMGSHLSTESQAASELGRLVVDPKFAGISGRYFDGSREIPSSAESRDESKAKTVWEQARTLAELTD